LLHDNTGARYFFIAIGLLIASGFSVLAWMWQQPIAQPPIVYSEKKAKPAPTVYSPLTGVNVGSDSLASRPVTAVMIENSPDARPQSGLKDAGIVFEAIAEGGITRFIALYQEARPSLIGPVRSVRPYYVEWASAYDPAVAHIGGSARALEMIRSGNYGTDIDQFFNASSYWRANDRAAPHNVYTDFDRLDSLVASKGKASSSFTPLPRKDAAKNKSSAATAISIPVSSGVFAVDYVYDGKTNTYARKQGGEAHNDREKGQIAPHVVIAIEVQMSRGMEDGNREQITTTGSGRAWIFQDGSVTEGQWQRVGTSDQFNFIDTQGKVVELNRGQTWISAVTHGRTPSWQ
ncbi:DUF3048 domain-containing protein, partial [Patescibacteria group bacterium]